MRITTNMIITLFLALILTEYSITCFQLSDKLLNDCDEEPYLPKCKNAKKFLENNKYSSCVNKFNRIVCDFALELEFLSQTQTDSQTSTSNRTIDSSKSLPNNNQNKKDINKIRDEIEKKESKNSKNRFTIIKRPSSAANLEKLRKPVALNLRHLALTDPPPLRSDILESMMHKPRLFNDENGDYDSNLQINANINSNSIDNNSLYRFKNVGTSKYIDLTATNQGNIFLFSTKDYSDWQTWRIIQSSDDYVKIQNSITDGLLTVDYLTGGLYLAHDNDSRLQDWKLSDEDGYTRLINREYGILTSEMDGSVANGDKIDNEYYIFQIWELEPY